MGVPCRSKPGEPIMTLNEALQGLSLGSLRSIFLFLFGCCLLMPGTARAQAQAAAERVIASIGGNSGRVAI